MFNLPVFFLTVEKVAFLLIFILSGYLLRRSKILGREAATVVSLVTTYIFSPAYTIANLRQNFTVENLKSNAALFAFSLMMVPIMILVARGLAKHLARDDFEKKSLSYFLAFSNNGYFGYPVMQGVFGQTVLGQFIVYCIPVNLFIYSYGYGLFAKEKKGRWKKVFFSPLIIGCYIGIFLGLTSLPLPGLVEESLDAAGACMSPCAMILAGLVIGSYPIKKLLTGARNYLYSFLRLILAPILFGIPLYLLGVRGIYLFLAISIASLPGGMNSIVYPESMGYDASENAKMCCISILLSIITLPVVFALLEAICGLQV